MRLSVKIIILINGLINYFSLFTKNCIFENGYFPKNHLGIFCFYFMSHKDKFIPGTKSPDDSREFNNNEATAGEKTKRSRNTAAIRLHSLNVFKSFFVFFVCVILLM